MAYYANNYNSWGGAGGSSNRPSTRKWWSPRNAEEAKKFESYKSDIQTLLTISKEGIPVRKAYGEIAEQIPEGEIPYKVFGFKNLGEFLFHCDDVLEVRTDGVNGYYLFLRGGRASEETEHLRRLVQGQSGKSKYKGFKARVGNTRLTSSDVLLRVLTRPENDAPKPPPTGFRGSSRSRAGRGRGRGGGRTRGGYRSVNSETYNGFPKLKPYNHSDYAPSPGLVNAVTRGLGLDEDYESDDNDFDDWYWSSDAKIDRETSDGEDIVDFRSSQPSKETISECRASEGVAKGLTTTVSNHTASPCVRKVEPTRTLNEADNKIGQLMQGVGLNSSSTLADRPPVLPQSRVTQKLNSNVAVASILKSKNEQSQGMPDPTLTSGMESKSLPASNCSGQPSLKATTLAIGALKTDSSVCSVKENSNTPSKIAQQSGTSEHSLEIMKPLRSLLSDQSVNSKPATRTHTGNPFLNNPTDYGKTNGDFGSVAAMATSFISGSQPGIDSFRMKMLPDNSMSVPSSLAANHKKNASMPEQKENITQVLSHTENAKVTLTDVCKPQLFPVKQMKIPKDKEFDAKLVGADGYGFFFFHVNSAPINAGYEQLKREIRDYYNSEHVINDCRLSPSEISVGMMVIAKVGGIFVRARVHERDIAHGICILVELEDHNFEVVKFENIFRIDRKFALRCARAVMCCLSGLEMHMMTSEIADAFERTPLYPPDVKVKWIEDSETFGVPVVQMTIHGDQDVLKLLKDYGNRHLKQISSLERVERVKFQRLQVDILQRKHYV